MVASSSSCDNSEDVSIWNCS